MNSLQLIQMTIFEPNIDVKCHSGAHWPIVLQFGEEYSWHTTWYLRKGQLDELIQNLLKAQLSLAIADADERRHDVKMKGGETE